VRAETDVLQDTGFAAFLAQIRMLGQRTAELHRAFAVPTDDPAFAPEKITKKDLQASRKRAREQADKALRALRDGRRHFNGEVADVVEQLLDRSAEITARLDELLPEDLDVMKTRCHGDYHLGQVVRVSNDFHILDFEGEPTRPLDERRLKRLPLIDVAGMLRSFDYATWTAVLRRSDLEPRAQEKVLACAMHWQREVSQEFLAGYEEAIGDCSSYPEDRAMALRIIQFYALEKALYEIAYEAAHRPDWLPIPVRGVQRLLDSEQETPWQP
jgi:maltose alpha-D-glucosyltransferase / alpha-amylase